MLKVGVGAAKALQECQRQFSFGRWNCSMTDGNSPILGKLMSKGTSVIFFDLFSSFSSDYQTATKRGEFFQAKGTIECL